MQQSVNEESVHYSHNDHGALPATFTDVEDANLRNFNRGAVLANIFERFVDEKTDPPKLQQKDFIMCIREVEAYLRLIPSDEHEDAKAAMVVHLNDRGYTDVS